MFKRFIASLVCVTFIFSNFQYIYAQDFNINQLPVPGTMVGESAPFSPLLLKGLVINPQKPLEFQFIVDTGKSLQDNASIKEEANKLVKYFLAGLTIPEGELWVNLSPYEKNRITTQSLGQTELGRDLLAQDYILKQLTASLIYPEKDLGKEFWSRVYVKAQQQFGTNNIPVNTFNKVWILPDQAQVFENGAAAYITRSTLKVMLDEDYLAKKKHQSTQASSISSQIVREIIIPEITKEVNTGKNFAPLRQIFQALILAKWYKEKIQNGILDTLYTNKKKISGVNLDDPTVKEQIYQRYLKAYKTGVFNYIKEDPTPDGRAVPRKYFSGGEVMIINLHEDGTVNDVGQSSGPMLDLTIDLAQTSNSKKLLFSEHVKDTVENTGAVVTIGGLLSIPVLFLYGVINMSIYDDFSSWNQTQGQFLKGLAINAYEVFKLVVQDPNSYKLAAVGVGLSAALLAWQNYSLQGLSDLLKKGSTDNEEAVKRLMKKRVRAVTILAEYYQKQNAYRLDDVLSFLVKMGDQRAIGPIADVLSKGEGNFEKGNEALRKLGASREIIFQANLKALNGEFKSKVTKFLGDFRDARAISGIANILAKGEYVALANEALQKLGADREIIFQSNLSALNSSGKVEVVEFLGNWGDARAIEGIAEILSKGSYISECNEALQKLGADKEIYYQAYIKMTSVGISNYYGKDIRKNAVRWLGDWGDKRAIVTLIKSLSDKERGVRGAARGALRLLGADKETLFQAYLGLANDQDSDISTEAIDWLADSGDKRAIGLLIGMLSNSHYGGDKKRKAARLALGKIGVDQEEMFQANLKLLLNNDEKIRRETIEALSNTGDQRAIKPLFMILQKSQPVDLRFSAANAIKILGKDYNFSNEENVRLNLVSRQPSGTQGDLFDYVALADQYASEGYDFNVIFEPETGHNEEDNSTGYSYTSYVIDTSEVLRIERGNKIADNAMSGIPDSTSLRFDLVKSALINGRIPLSEVADTKLVRFLQLLHGNEIGHLVVIGGSVRDIFFGKNINDIDIGVSIQMSDEERRLASHVGAQATKKMYETSLSSLDQLAQVLNVPVKRFFDKDNPPRFQGVKLHYLGPILNPARGEREEIILQGLIADNQTHNVYSSYTVPGLLSMAIDPQGVLYGFKLPLQDALNGKVHFQGDLKNGRNLSLLIIIKWLRLKHEFGLTLSGDDLSLIEKILGQKDNNVLTDNASILHQAMQELVDGAGNPQAALNDLNGLGLIQLTGFQPKIKGPINFVLSRWKKILNSRILGLQASAFALSPVMPQDQLNQIINHWITDHQGELALGAGGLTFTLGLTWYLWQRYTLTGILSEADTDKRLEKLRKYMGDKDFDSLIGLLKYPYSDVQQIAIEELALSGDKKAIEPLLDFMIKGGSQYYIVKALNQLGASQEQLFRAHMNIIKSSNWIMMGESFKALGELGDKRSLMPLLEIMGKGNLNPELVEAVKKLGASPEEIFQGFVGAFNNGNTGALEPLITFNDKRAIEPLLASLIYIPLYGESQIKPAVVNALEKLGATREDFLSGYERFLFSSKNEVRTIAAKEIIKLGGYTHEDILKKLLDRQPLNAEGKLVEFVTEAIKYKEEGYDFKAVFQSAEGHYEDGTGPYGEVWPNSLYVVHSPEVLRIERGDQLPKHDAAMLGLFSFLVFLSDKRIENYMIGRTTAKLIEILGRDFGSRGDSNALHIPAAYALGKRGDKRGIEYLAKLLLGNDGADTQIKIARDLGRLNNREGIDYLLKIMTYDEDFVRNSGGSWGAHQYHAAEALIETTYEDKDVIEKLLQRDPVYYLPGPYNNIFRFFMDARRFKQEGYDFNVIFEPEIAHDGDEIGVTDYDAKTPVYEKIIDSELVFRIEKGDQLPDRAMLKPIKENGGIDLNQIAIKRTGKTIKMQFDSAQLNALQQEGFEGFTPVIIDITPISSPFQLLGINQPTKEPELSAKA